MPHENTFTAGGNTYALMRMDPRIQLLILKRLMRFVPALTNADKLIARIRSGEPVEAGDALNMMVALGPILADTPDADIDFVFDNSLSSTRQRTAEGRWQPVRSTADEHGHAVVMNQDNEAVVRKLVIVSNVLRSIFAPMLAEIAPAITDITRNVADAGSLTPETSVN